MSALTQSSFYQHELRKLIEVEIEVVKQNMSNGHLPSYEEYKYQVGRVAGMRAAIDLMLEAERICEQR